MNYLELQDQVLFRAGRDATPAQFRPKIKTMLNVASRNIRTEALWPDLKETERITTEADYTTGTIAVTNNSDTVTGTSTLWVTNNIRIDRRIVLPNNDVLVIKSVDSETGITLVEKYGGATASTQTYTIVGREEYRTPLDFGWPAFLWHEAFGRPFVMNFARSDDFYRGQLSLGDSGTPRLWRMWGKTGVDRQPTSGSIMTISSSDSDDKSIAVRIEGIVSDVPDAETVTTNASDGTTTVDGAKSFTKVDRITIDSDKTPEGRITVTSNSANVTVVVLPSGAITRSLEKFLFQIWPPPDSVIILNLYYYAEILDMVNDDDRNPLGDEFDEVLIRRTHYLLMETLLNVQTAQQILSEYRREISKLKGFFSTNPAQRFIRRQRDLDFDSGTATEFAQNFFLRFGDFFPIVGRPR